MAVFWVVAPCNLVDVYQRFRSACYLHNQGDESSSETSVNFYQTTRRYNPEDSRLQTHRCENLKSYNLKTLLVLGILYTLLVKIRHKSKPVSFLL
jgi:protein subunit release factor A